MDYIVVLLGVIGVGLSIESIPTDTRKAIAAIVIILSLLLGLAGLTP